MAVICVCSQICNWPTRPTKSAGPDNINARVLKELNDVIIEPVTLLFNNSLNQGMVPQEWKKALVTPIHKKGNKKLA